jgi:sec-independent protein translocase protein TatC
MAPVPTLERPLPQSAHDDDDTSLIELTDPQEVELDAGRMSFLEHLDELRKRLIASLIGIAIGCVIAFIFLDSHIFPFIMLPMQRMLPDAGTLITTEPSEFFMLWIKVGFFGGLLIAMPFMLYQLWLFVAPGLYSHEKRFAIPFVLFASVFFFGGAMFSHYVAFPVTWGFFIAFNPSFVQFMPKIGPAFALYVKMMLACGVVFQMPVLVFALARMGMVTAGFLLRNFKYAVLIIAILGAILSPGGDIASQMILSGPMLVLYVVSIGVAWAFQKRKPAADAAS